MDDAGRSIRVATAEDASALSAIYAPYVQRTAISFEYEAPDAAEFARRIAHTLAHYPYLVAVEDGEIVGYAYAGRFSARRAYDWAVETSIYVRRDIRKKGLGHALYTALAAVLAAQGFTNMNACIAYPPDGRADAYLDTNSARFHEHLGFRLVGRFTRCAYKFDTWYDMVWMERALGPHVTSPPAPLPFPQVMDRLPRILDAAAHDAQG